MQLFRYLSYKELVRVMNITETHEHDTGSPVFVEGDAGEAMFVVLGGKVGLTKAGVPVAELGRGQHFGEMALVDRTQRSLTATALEPSRLLAIKRKEFYAIIKKEPALSVKLLWSFVQVLADRLRKTTADLSGALRGDPRLTDPGDHLFHE
jgi:CRP-like cAMP-binding protein